MKTIKLTYTDWDTGDILEYQYQTELIFKDVKEFDKFLAREVKLIICEKDFKKENEVIELERIK